MFKVECEKISGDKWVIHNPFKDKKIIVDDKIYQDLIKNNVLNNKSQYFDYLLKENFFEELTTPPLYESIETNFYKSSNKNEIRVLGVPYDAGSTGITGSKEAVNKLRNETVKNRIALKIFDFQNVTHIPGESIEVFHNRLEEVYKNINKNKVIAIGGDHSITYPIVNSFEQQSFTLIKFDAHHDSHRQKRFEKINHSNFINLIREKSNVENIIHLGLREEYSSLFSEKDKLAIDCLKGNKKKEAYITIDMDVLDPRIFKSVGFVLDNGMALEELLVLLDIIFKNFKILGIDIVEYNPLIDKNEDYIKVLRILEFCIVNWQ